MFHCYISLHRFVTSFEQVFWSVTSCFRVFPIYLNRFICYETGWVYKKKKMYVSSLHFVSPCFVTSFEHVFWSVTSCFRVFPIYLNRFICYETEMGLKKKKNDVSLLHFVTPCFVTSFEQFFWTVTSCFRVFPIYLNRFICYETEMGL